MDYAIKIILQRRTVIMIVTGMKQFTIMVPIRMAIGE